MNTSELQQELFKIIKASMPAHLSLTEEIAKVLQVSSDSVYRRLRGEKTISLDELQLLCTHYKISLDQLMNIETGAFTFQGNFLNYKTFRFDEYLKGIINNLTYYNSFKQREFYHLGKDVHIFHHFHFREIAAFKYFFWMKTIFHFPEFTNLRFNFDIYTEELAALGNKILDSYNQLPSVELWNLENINTAFRQIEFYKDGHMFESDNDIFKLYEAWEKLIDHIEKQAEKGYKFNYGDPSMNPISEYRVYFNEVMMGDNSMILILNGVKLAVINHTVINYMQTRDVNFCENLFDYAQSLMRRSTLISTVSEKERSKFFHSIRERITRRKDALKIG